MVEKLRLPIEEHPQPYTLAWNEKENEIKDSK